MFSNVVDIKSMYYDLNRCIRLREGQLARFFKLNILFAIAYLRAANDTGIVYNLIF